MENIMADCITRKARVNVFHETREDNAVDGQPAYTRPLPQLQVIRGFQQPVCVTGTPNVVRGDARVNYRRKKLEQLSI